MIRGAIAEIDLKALGHNFKTIKKITKNLPVIAVVKADAYGHGAVEISKRLSRLGADYLAVAFSEEAKELRESGIDSPIIVLFDNDFRDFFKLNLIPVIHDKKYAHFLSKEALKNNREIIIHIKIDTGMGRLGIPCDRAVEDIVEIANLKGINIEGVMSHLSDADNPHSSFSISQIDIFRKIKCDLSDKGLKIKYFHIANSAATLTLPESHFDAVRPGLMLYGYSSLKNQKENQLKPIMSLKTEIIALRRLKKNTPVSYGKTYVTKRDSLIGVVRIGYADSFRRSLSNNSYVLVKGRRVPVVGTICMDLSMVDLTDLKDVKESEEVIIIGRQGDEVIDACELASWAGTIPYEILTSLGSRAIRIYED